MGDGGRCASVSRYATRMLPGLALLAVLGLLAGLLPGAPRSSSSSSSGGQRSVASAGPDARFPSARDFARRADETPIAGSLKAVTASRVPPEGSGAAARGDTYQGVTASTILIGGSAQVGDCGGANPAAQAAALGVTVDQSKNELYKYGIPTRYFSRFGLGDYPLPADVAANVGAGRGFWGRTLRYKFYNDGGAQCPETARAVATRLVEQDKVFAGIKGGTDGVEREQAKIYARRKLPFVGLYGASPQIYRELGPYTYNGHWAADHEQVIALGSLACRDYAGRRARNTGDSAVSGKPRKFGVIHIDLPEVNLVKDILLAEVAKCGVHPEVASYPLDAGQVSSVAASTLSKFRAAGVTTILNLIDFVFISIWTNSATGQGYRPEWLNSGYLLQDVPLVIQTYWDEEQAKQIFAVSGRLDASVKAPAYGATPGARMFRTMAPNEPLDATADVMYDQFFLFVLGVAGAGRDLTAQTWKQGLMRLCNPCSRTHPLLPLKWIAGPDDHQMYSDFTIVHWNPSKVDHTGPPDANGNRRAGYWDHPEAGLRYIGTVYNPE